jgi:hypothetical protein
MNRELTLTYDDGAGGHTSSRNRLWERSRFEVPLSARENVPMPADKKTERGCFYG